MQDLYFQFLEKQKGEQRKILHSVRGEERKKERTKEEMIYKPKYCFFSLEEEK